MDGGGRSVEGSVKRKAKAKSDIAVVLRICALLLPAVLLRNRWPLPRLVRFFESAPRSGHDAANLARARRLTDGILHRLFGGAFCMKRALILYHFMTRSNMHKSSFVDMDAELARRQLEVLQQTIRRATCHMLVAGPDIKGNPDAADALLRPLFDA